jgi:hypothetical protein
LKKRYTSAKKKNGEREGGNRFHRDQQPKELDKENYHELFNHPLSRQLENNFNDTQESFKSLNEVNIQGTYKRAQETGVSVQRFQERYHKLEQNFQRFTSKLHHVKQAQ